MLHVNSTYPLMFPPGWICASAACRRNQAWSKWSRISSNRSVNTAKRASCAAICRTAVVASSTVDIPRLYQVVRSHRRSATMRDEYGAVCCLSQVKDRSETGWHERPSEVTPYAPAIQANFRASGDLMLDTMITNRKDSILYGYKLPEKTSLDKSCAIAKYNVRKWTNAHKNCRVNKETLTSLMVTDNMIQCKVCERHNARRKVILQKWFNSAGVISRKEENAERNNEQLMFHLSEIQWRKGPPRRHPNRIASFWKALTITNACKKTKARTNTWKVRPSRKWTSGHRCELQLQDLTRYQRVNILNLAKLTALD